MEALEEGREREVGKAASRNKKEATFLRIDNAGSRGLISRIVKAVKQDISFMERKKRRGGAWTISKTWRKSATRPSVPSVPRAQNRDFKAGNKLP
ncbi:hypothetical protein KM043_016658 [Ampulex compressa]|nr:hypothetical protein KM043_016658 [Ampulex compressa]